ncbi:hypothetical protein PAPHI01_0765 [Pancytospora philotis]|nr:hypothetical protein PAPHI01_0765 [Pancytospora philotis]
MIAVDSVTRGVGETVGAGRWAAERARLFSAYKMIIEQATVVGRDHSAHGVRSCSAQHAAAAAHYTSFRTCIESAQIDRKVHARQIFVRDAKKRTDVVLNPSEYSRRMERLRDTLRSVL